MVWLTSTKKIKQLLRVRAIAPTVSGLIIVSGVTDICPGLIFNSNSGAYLNADAHSEELLYYLGKQENFLHPTAIAGWQRDLSQGLSSDRLEAMVVTATHPNDRRVTKIQQWLWILGWSFIGSSLSLVLFNMNLSSKDSANVIKPATISIVVPVGLLSISSYLLFWSGWWLSTIAPLPISIAVNLIVTGYQVQKQRRIAFTDSLTKIANRRFGDRYLERQWSNSQRKKTNLAVIWCDLDFWKIYNDTYGHQQGDVCLQKIASILSSSVRGSDLAARYGGDKFLIVLPDSNTKVALLVADRLRSKIKAMQITHAGSKVSQYVSISMGIASLEGNQIISLEELLAAADRALDLAKQQGRDRIVVNDETSLS